MGSTVQDEFVGTADLGPDLKELLSVFDPRVLQLRQDPQALQMSVVCSCMLLL